MPAETLVRLSSVPLPLGTWRGQRSGRPPDAEYRPNLEPLDQALECVYDPTAGTSTNRGVARVVDAVALEGDQRLATQPSITFSSGRTPRCGPLISLPGVGKVVVLHALCGAPSRHRDAVTARACEKLLAARTAISIATVAAVEPAPRLARLFQRPPPWPVYRRGPAAPAPGGADIVPMGTRPAAAQWFAQTASTTSVTRAWWARNDLERRTEHYACGLTGVQLTIEMTPTTNFVQRWQRSPHYYGAALRRWPQRAVAAVRAVAWAGR